MVAGESRDHVFLPPTCRSVVLIYRLPWAQGASNFFANLQEERRDMSESLRGAEMKAVMWNKSNSTKEQEMTEVNWNVKVRFVVYARFLTVKGII